LDQWEKVWGSVLGERRGRGGSHKKKHGVLEKAAKKKKKRAAWEIHRGGSSHQWKELIGGGRVANGRTTKKGVGPGLADLRKGTGHHAQKGRGRGTFHQKLEFENGAHYKKKRRIEGEWGGSNIKKWRRWQQVNWEVVGSLFLDKKKREPSM